MKLVVPIDRSERDAIIIPYATGICSSLGASIAVVHVVPPPRSLIPSAVREAEAYADAVAQQMRQAGLEADSFIGRGNPADLILQLIRDLAPDMVVMATRGRRGLHKVMLGSVADSVLKFCPVPLLLVNADALQVLQSQTLSELSSQAA